MREIFDLHNLLRFWPAFLAEMTVIVLAVLETRRDSPMLASRVRSKVGNSDRSGLWCLPFYLWALQANMIAGALFNGRVGLAAESHLRIHDEMTAIFYALLHLLVLQTIGTIVTHEAPATLGLTSYTRTAVTAAVLSVFLNIALFFWIL